MKIAATVLIFIGSMFAQSPLVWTHYDISRDPWQYRSYNTARFMDGKFWCLDGKYSDLTIYSGMLCTWDAATQTFTEKTYVGDASSTGSDQRCSNARAWTASFAYHIYEFYTDSALHLQRVTTGGTSGGSEPSWNHAGGTTTSGSVTWTDMGIRPPPRHPIGQWWADTNRHRIYVTGGVCDTKDPETPGRPHTWLYDNVGSAWDGLVTTNSPFSLGGENWQYGATAFDSDDNIAFQYGGGFGNVYLLTLTDLNPIPGTLTTDQTNAGGVAEDWVKVTTSGTAPSAKVFMGSVYIGGGKAVLFGGAQSASGGSTTYNETVCYNIRTKTFTVLNDGSSNSPPVVIYDQGLKGQPAMAYNSRNGLIYTWANQSGHMWTLNPAACTNGIWTDLGAGSGPICTNPAQQAGCTDKMVYDDVNNALLLEAYTSDADNSVTMWVASLPAATGGPTISGKTTFSGKGTF